ncbi:hypothetical protein [Nocardioides stalactiti]|uniref:hypothetical protein n=1 Tax=Nocardioides stalactiti TaxID=2755356 RepID=UPI0028AD8971|nr:hypothetical protein [Nocardioides stalactiti]
MKATTVRRLACTVLVGTALAACSTDEGGDGGTSDGDPEVVEITFENGAVTPNGERVEVDKGQPIDLVVTADEPGTLHLHSDPEQEFAYDAGTETFEIQIDRPGIIEVESHELDQVIVQLEVR